MDAETREPLPGATLQIGPARGAIANEEGYLEISGIAEDTIEVTVSFVGYSTFRQQYPLPQQGVQTISLVHGEEMEEVIVTTTRSSRMIDDIPTRIEAISSEELEEKAMMRSNNIAMVLRESTGIQMQQTSASSANQSIRIQGLDGRYTQLLKDGFPLFGGFAGGLSIMQIPPLDLKQIEVIKGSNSTLFGGGAIAGLVNLVTHTPEDERKLKFMLDQTSAGGSTFNAFYGKRFDKFGLTLYTSANRQEAYDPNGDDFSDIPRIRSLTVNPSLFYYPNDRSSLRLSLSGTFENREGGYIAAIEDGANLFTERNTSDRYSYQLTYRNDLGANRALTVKHSLTHYDREITEPSFIFSGEQWSSFSEVAYTYGTEKSHWIAGLNLYTDEFNEMPSDSLRRDYSYTTLGAFSQNTWDISERVSLESGLRMDYDLDYGLFALPRVSLLGKLSEAWAIRLGGGMGYKLPTIFTEDAENLTFEGILPIDIQATDAERSIGANVDVNYKTSLGENWSLSVNQLFFYTALEDALVFRENASGRYYYENADGPVSSRGLETNAKLGYRDIKLFANYALIDTRLSYDNLNGQKPLTPKHNIGLVLMYEVHGKWRIGYEAYYTGEQFREDRSRTEDFWTMGLMAMRKFGPLALYVNFENFTDTRQHRLEDFSIGNYLKPNTSQFWAPTDGRVINGGIILEL